MDRGLLRGHPQGAVEANRLAVQHGVLQDGAHEVGELLGPAQARRNHIAVDILFERFAAALQRVFEGISHLACAVFFGLVGYRLVLLGFELRRAGELSETLQIAFYPVVWFTALGTGVLVLTLVWDAWRTWWLPEGRR